MSRETERHGRPPSGGPVRSFRKEHRSSRFTRSLRDLCSLREEILVPNTLMIRGYVIIEYKTTYPIPNSAYQLRSYGNMNVQIVQLVFT